MIDRIEITFAEDGRAVVTAPAPSPYAKAAAKLSQDPSSGWSALPPGEGGEARFSAPAKAVMPKGLRKGRPDAAAHLDAWRARKKAKAQPQPQPEPPDPTEELLRRRYARRDAEARESHIPIVDPFDPGDF